MPTFKEQDIAERYKNIGNDSGVSAYELGQSSITGHFKDGAVYLYTNQSAGALPTQFGGNHRRRAGGSPLSSLR